MTCKCPRCKSTLAIDRTTLQQLNQNKFKCPNCSIPIQIKPSISKCGSCGTGFKYFDYKFSKDKPHVSCPSCKKVNKLKLKY